MVLGTCRKIKPRPPGRTGWHDRASSVAQIALLFALSASFSRACPSHPGGGASFPERLPDPEGLRSNLEEVEQRVETACLRVGRSDRPRLLVASKYLASEEMGVLERAGIRLVGENRADELQTKWQRWNGTFEFHFIGHLQSRKVRQVLPCVSMVHSVDSISLVEEIDRRAEAAVQALLEVNVAGEESKYGILPAAAEAFLERAAVYRNVIIVGLMTMAPLVADPEQVRPCFRGLRELRDRLAAVFAGRYELSELSMGMSNDYEVAVEEGATIIRLGSALLSGR